MTIVYKNGGNTYLGRLHEKTLTEWKKLGTSLFQRFMYKGYRYHGGEKDVVVVFDLSKWSSAEIRKRKSNGFLGIREYRLPNSRTRARR